MYRSKLDLEYGNQSIGRLSSYEAIRNDANPTNTINTNSVTKRNCKNRRSRRGLVADWVAIGSPLYSYF